jgi:GNAT superfamily N-acetyltransferase
MSAASPAGGGLLRVHNVRAEDLDAVIAIDAEVTRLPKPAYWAEIYQRYGAGRRPRRGGRPPQRFFLVAEARGRIEGFVIGEVRDWEFGSPRCGWVFAISVRPGARLAGVGARLLEAICEGFRGLGVTKVRTMLARDNQLILSFFRSQGMTAAPFIPLEMDLDADRPPA